jgi:ribosomal protein S20
MNKSTMKNIIKKSDELVEALDAQAEAANALIDSIKNYQEFLEQEAERLKKGSV